MIKINSFLKLLTQKESFDTLILNANSYDGYLREEAIKSLGNLGNIHAIPTLLVRANDWVYQVREASLEAISQLLLDENAQILVTYLPEIYKLQNYERTSHTALFREIMNILLKNNNSMYLIEAIESDNFILSRLAFLLCVEHHITSNENLVKKGLMSKDMMLRIYASRLLSKLDKNYLEYFLDIAIKDKVMYVRREALEIMIEVLPSKGLSLSYIFLFDKNVSIREIAVKYLQKNQIDIESIFMKVLRDKNATILHLSCAIDTLGAMKITSSIDMIKEYFSHRSPSVRKACLEVLVSFSKEKSYPYLMQGLQDSSAKIAKKSSRLFLEYKYIKLEEILDIIEKVDYTHTLSSCLFVIRDINKWERLLLLLKYFNTSIIENKSKKFILENELKHWDFYSNKVITITKVTSIQKKEIILYFSKISSFLRKDNYEALSFTIRILSK
jgi:HEAT repeat protein